MTMRMLIADDDNLYGLNDNATEDDDKSPQCCAFGTGPDPTPECFFC